MDHQAVLDEAIAAAKAAVQAYTEQIQKAQPDLKVIDHFGPCGFAWVNMKPATSSFARWLSLKRKNETLSDKGRSRIYGYVDDYYGGVTWWDPGQWGGQSLCIKEEGAEAFARVLRKHGFKATAHTRLD